jgi:hypothetical protein
MTRVAATNPATTARPSQITGVTADGLLNVFTGIVQSVEENLNKPASRWRITMLDAK